jgi:hypothetical protein
MKQTYRLVHAEARRRALDGVRDAPEGWVVTVGEPSRSGEQSAKFHAICNDIAKSKLVWAGKRRNSVEWKCLLVSGHSVATGQGAEVIPGIEGEFLNIRESTASMSRQRGASLIEYALAFCAMNGINSQRSDYEATSDS